MLILSGIVGNSGSWLVSIIAVYTNIVPNGRRLVHFPTALHLADMGVSSQYLHRKAQIDDKLIAHRKRAFSRGNWMDRGWLESGYRVNTCECEAGASHSLLEDQSWQKTLF